MPIKKISKTKALVKAADMKVVAEEMHQLHNHIIKLKRDTAINFLDFGKCFSKIKNGNMYEAIGFETFGEYIGDLGFGRSTVFSLINIYELYVEKFKINAIELADIHWSKLMMISPVVNDKNYEDLLEKSKVLSRSDLKIEVDKYKNSPHYTGQLSFNEEEEVLNIIKGQCPIHKGNFCPHFNRPERRADILHDYKEKNKVGK